MLICSWQRVGCHEQSSMSSAKAETSRLIAESLLKVYDHPWVLDAALTRSRRGWKQMLKRTGGQNTTLKNTNGIVERFCQSWGWHGHFGNKILVVVKHQLTERRGKWYRDRHVWMNMCFILPNAFFRSNQAKQIFRWCRRASLIASWDNVACSMQPAMPGRNPFWVRPSK